MGVDAFEVSVNALKMVVIFLMIVSSVPFLVWLERRGAAFMQNRLGPNRVGPLGLVQLLADALKFITKEEFRPKTSVRFMYYAAPVVSLVPGALALAAIPLSSPIHVESFNFFGYDWGPYVFLAQGYDVGSIGVIFVLAISSLATYSVLMAGFGSGNKYSLLGAMRASAQMISYELSLSLAVVGIILVFGTFSFTEIIQQQQGPLQFTLFGEPRFVPWLPNWGIFYQPLGALLFFTASFAESQRLPFDLAESEAELVAGFHTEYGGFKMLLFFIGEYSHMIVTSALLVTFFFGGFGLPFVSVADVNQFFVENWGSTSTWASLLTSLFFLGVFLSKMSFFIWFFIWVRWTLPRFRYDHLMDLGWKSLLPWAMANAVITAILGVLLI